MPERNDSTSPEKTHATAWKPSRPPLLRIPDGTEMEHPILYVDDTPCLVCKTNPGEVKYYVPLITEERKRHEGAPLETVWVLPYDEIVPATFRRAVLIEGHQRRD